MSSFERKDKNLIAKVASAGVEVALKGLASPHWEVRNAGSMCFSALALRLLGFKNEGNRSSLTSFQLFQRFPQLLPVLVHHLKAGMRKLVSATALPPAVFPILALLSRLRYSWTRLSASECFRCQQRCRIQSNLVKREEIKQSKTSHLEHNPPYR
jgi:hypothetical protein